LAKIKHGGYNGGFVHRYRDQVLMIETAWLWIFFVEGVITVCVEVLALFFMCHTPAQAKFLDV
jgi:hypothetical protein